MRIATSLAAALLLFLGGCSSDKLAPVSGTVTMDGKPLANANVNFQPIGSDKEVGPGSYGKTDANGHYSLRLIATKERTGAVVGKHKVSITLELKDQSDVSREKQPIPARYNAKSTLEIDVPSGGKDDANFSLDSKPDPTPKIDRGT